ncbi:MAG: hypothetical protein AUJ92_04570 [Armatimonadetes bacterium CG2_30_59_28]|nr:DUF58 domain-containing protein [Armatimonadota bacterium]OIO97001.1 MAG: hypothetical protein AUJ92_04570 [Armatimonadetes bacterium CG2_30_59_28]PIU64238.1 MAG: DUF58 domain-containing protein [Armatimonadetes bacterium CG07_land_8_20_14_0_80_59_28]PIX43322.1 MAG: DUF58 domain-containing protein [Armatimonadetes bacterium CG_4_8_14_3_um_filter_58_9]PIY38218.1 MAG: DUF58 domain-containing protein [Armatimonadetes bacterium CG_4_10_14_3_um_filter_59_10]
MITQEILKKVRRIEIRTSKFVNDIFAGEYESVFKGHGLEFAEVREYQPGDDVRTIDWKVTARMRRPYVRKYQEERELTVMLVVDASRSVDFGFAQMKRDVATEICALLAFSAIKNNDKVGLIVFTNRVEKFVPPRKGRKHVLRVIRDLLEFSPEETRTNIAGALEYLNRVVRRHAVVFLVSDFSATGFEKDLRVSHRRHDVIALTIQDPAERSLPELNCFIEWEDAETGEVFVADTADPEVRQRFDINVGTRERERQRLFRSMHVDYIDITTGQSYLEPLVRFFRERARRFR